MSHYMPPMRMRTMLKHVQPLPRPQRHASFYNRDRQTRLRKRRPDMRRHIVRPLRPVPVMFAALRRQPLEKIAQIERYIRIGVFLNNQRTGSMLRKQRHQAARNPLLAKPFLDCVREWIKPFAARRNDKVGVACHTSNSYIL
jgi:hypothetical protein